MDTMDTVDTESWTSFYDRTTRKTQTENFSAGNQAAGISISQRSVPIVRMPVPLAGHLRRLCGPLAVRPMRPGAT